MTRAHLTLQRGVRLASLLQGVLNDLKRDAASAAQELGLTTETLARALDGDWAAGAQVRDRILLCWPVSERDLAPLVDDTDDGLAVCSAAAAAASSRVLTRGGVDYYEYRDVAMSERSPIRPEWIRMLGRTRALDPHDAALRWNEGHALHQLTYFRGSVDFYVEAHGERRAYAMQDGDSAFIPSFLPHTFATRDPGPQPHIIAVTFHGRIHGDVSAELSLTDLGDLDRALRDTATFSRRLHRILEDGCIPVATLASSSGVSPERVSALLSGVEIPTPAEIARFARSLGVRSTDLHVNGHGPAAPVVVVRSAGTQNAAYPDDHGPNYQVRPLARSEIAPRAWGFVVAACRSADAPALAAGSHQFGYVLGPGRVHLRREGFDGLSDILLEPGDSFYTRPWLEHRLIAAEEKCEILLFRAPQALGPEALHELGQSERRAQVGFATAQTAWYRP